MQNTDTNIMKKIRARLALTWLRRATTILGPLSFSLRTGHWRSALTQRAMDGKGNALPWYSYPAIRFLSEGDYTEANVLEFGGGQSTLWWACRAKSVTVLDPHKRWADWLSNRVPPNVRVHHLHSCSDQAAILGEQNFEVIVVDAGSEDNLEDGRILNMETAIGRMTDSGLIVVDNSTASYGGAIAAIAAKEGFDRVDFIGFPPGGMTEYGTSIFFRKFPEMLRSSEPTVILSGAPRVDPA